MADPAVPRRQFLSTSAAAIAGAMMPATATGQPPQPPEPPQPPPTSLNLGVASYSLRNFPLDKAIEMVKALGTTYVNFKSVHMPFELSPEQLAAARREIEAPGRLGLGGGGCPVER